MSGILYQIFKSFSKTEKYLLGGFFIIFIVSGALLSILLFREATVETPVPSNIYHEGVKGQPIAVNPVLISTNDVDRDLSKLLFTDLLTLAEEYKMSQDGQIWNITLKPDLKWSDGKPLTSDDVIFTIDTILHPDTRSPLLRTWQGIIVNRVSNRKIEFTIRTPYAFFPDNLKDLQIIPEHIFRSIPPANLRLSDFNLEPVGNGPYKYASLEKEKGGFIKNYRLTTNEYFSGVKPFLKELEIKFYRQDQELIDAFNLKRVDGFGGLNPKNLNGLKLEHQIWEKNMPAYYAIFINKGSKSALGDKNVIRALQLTVEKSKIIEQVFDGKALLVNAPILPFMKGFDRSTEPISEFSPTKAAELLEKSGWKLNEKNGVREKKIGKTLEALEFSIVVPQIPFLTETIEIISKEMNKIGIKLNLIVLNPSDILQEVIKTRNYQLIAFGNTLKNNADLFSFWHSSERFYPGLNLSLYENNNADKLIEAVRKNFNEEARNEDLSKLQKLIIEDLPAIFLYSPLYLYVAPKDLKGFEEKIISTPADRFQNINRWYLETVRVFQ